MAAPATSTPQLLYVSDLGHFDVAVFTYPALKLVGRLTGFDRPQGACSDALGNVWIANAGTEQMLEFAHGGTSPIATLNDPNGVPVGCALDANGDLAVTNLFDGGRSGSVLVYRQAHGTPRVYSAPNLYDYYFDGYDAAGNLYASGTSSSKTFGLAVLPVGARAMTPVAVHGATIHFPGTVAWRGPTLVLGDQQCKGAAASCFYELSLSGRTATVKHVTALTGSCDVVQAWVGPTRIAGGDDGENCGRPSNADTWPYPAGGKPTVTATGVRAPVGATVSTIPKS